MLELFTTSKYDSNILVKTEHNSYSVKDIKELVAGKIQQIKSLKENVVITSGDNFAFVINFLAAVFSYKNIYLVTEQQKIKDLPFEYDILDNNIPNKQQEYSFPDIDCPNKNSRKAEGVSEFLRVPTLKGEPYDGSDEEAAEGDTRLNINLPIINFFTSGSTEQPKCIKKSLFNLIEEAKDAAIELQYSPKPLIVKSTTTMCHLFGTTFHFMFPLCNGHIIDTTRVLYPENVDKKNCLLVSTPAFLSSICKHNLLFDIAPKYIITAGAKLDNDTFKYLEQFSKVTEIYGSTETGIIAYRNSAEDEYLTIFPNVKVLDNNTIITNYGYGETIEICDNIEVKENSPSKFRDKPEGCERNLGVVTLKGKPYDGSDDEAAEGGTRLNKLKVLGRKDRILKIYDKRVSVSAIEKSLIATKLVKQSYCLENNGKLASICALSEEGKNYLISNGIIELEKLLKQAVSQVSEVLPQKWKFCDELPLTQSGKINKDFISYLFNVKFSLPIILEKIVNYNEVIYKLFFYKNSNFYKGHFPNFPITPGVAQLYLANELAKYNFSNCHTSGQIKKIKFTNIIFPDSIIYLSIKQSDKGIAFSYYQDDKIFSSGVFPIIDIFEGAL